jgi:hypothetical protein
LRGREQQYRRALRWYPIDWRNRNEDVVVGTLKDVAEEEGRSRPAAGELANLRLTGIAAHLNGLGRTIPAAVRDRAASVALGLGAAIAGGGIVQNFTNSYTPGYPAIGGAGNLGFVFFAVWIAAFITALFGLRRAMIVLLATSIPVSIGMALLSQALGMYDHTHSMTMFFLALLAAIGVAGSPARLSQSGANNSAITRSRFPLVGTLVVASVLIGAFQFAPVRNVVEFLQYGPGGLDLFWAPLASLLAYVGIPVGVVVSVILWRTKRSAWTGALLLLCTATLPITFLEINWRAPWYEYLGIFALVAAAVVAIYALLRLFDLRVTVTRL